MSKEHKIRRAVSSFDFEAGTMRREAYVQGIRSGEIPPEGAPLLHRLFARSGAVPAVPTVVKKPKTKKSGGRHAGQ